MIKSILVSTSFVKTTEYKITKLLSSYYFAILTEMGRVKNATLPYILSFITLGLIICLFYQLYLAITSQFWSAYPFTELVVSFVCISVVLKFMPILFVKTDLFVPFYNIAMYPPKRSNISKMEWANEMMRRKKYGKLPFSSKYPNGWYSVCRSSDLAKGQVKPVNILGKSTAHRKTLQF